MTWTDATNLIIGLVVLWVTGLITGMAIGDYRRSSTSRRKPTWDGPD